MQNASFHPAIWADLAAAALDFEQRLGLRRLKRGMLAMLAAWLAYFVVINMWVRTLNKVIVPFFDMPLGVFLVAQGTAVIFVAAVVMLVRKARDAIAA
jgi:putative solute:sodium symporter small subunit